MSKKEQMDRVLKMQNLNVQDDMTVRGVTTIGSVSPTSLQFCISPLPSSATSIGFCNN
ncbi:hypothetical protein ACJVW2_11200 [Staphylococcus coagulans]|uniref:hypothetical protein n=1 Tax=Staphylococcus TaxID=1279 RepID=UPI001BE0DC47|nr:hypothetical protein [Staphylococcus pseudintermedius]MDF0070696.1 hypothetical protein [Staphylococcus pseudintermedius]MDF0082653.1 hypothetical protein [Staphylococcus pseudintermedius]